MTSCVAGVDLGGTKIEIGLVDDQNTILGRCRIPTHPERGPKDVAARIASEVAQLERALPAGQRVAALGICCPGPVDHRTGTLIDPPNLQQLHHAALGPMLAARLDVPVSLEHDAKAAALGEYFYGAGRGEPSMVFIVVGTGVGAAIIMYGELYRGVRNSAGEVGHITLDPHGERCACGSRGCVETYVGGPWLVRRYERALAALAPGPALGHGPLTGERVACLAAEGDPVARKVIVQAGEALGIAVASMAMILNIDLYVVGGSVVKCGDMLLDPARRVAPQYCYRSVGCEVRIEATELGDDGPILGCAWLARQALAQCERSGT